MTAGEILQTKRSVRKGAQGLSLKRKLKKASWFMFSMKFKRAQCLLKNVQNRTVKMGKRQTEQKRDQETARNKSGSWLT